MLLAMFAAGRPAGAQTQLQLAQLHIKHVIVIMQENRSFDSYFGTFPGADGIAFKKDGHPVACYPTGVAGQACVAPFHDRHGENAGGVHNAPAAIEDIDGGLMDGFIKAAQHSYDGSCYPTTKGVVACAGVVLGFRRHDTVGYHTADEIPNYWAYAHTYVLMDHLFSPVASDSLPAHLYMTSAWSAHCSNLSDPMTCSTWISPPLGIAHKGVFAWSDLTDLLDRAAVTWKYYLEQGQEPDCEDGEMTCPPETQQAGVESWWNPLPGFTEALAKNKANPGYLAQHNPPLEQFYADLQNGTLPAISWIVPTEDDSEHPAAEVQHGMMYVTSLINAVMQSSVWPDSVIFLAWDDWGGFADHVVPPNSDFLPTGSPVGYGLRVPGMIISPWVIGGTIDHQVYSFDAYLKFMEDLFLDSERIGGKTGLRPDGRTVIRESLTTLTPGPGQGSVPVPVGNLLADFNFGQTPVAPLIQTTLIPVDFQPTFTTAYVATFPLTWARVTAGPVATYTVKRTTTSGSGYEPVQGCSPSGKWMFRDVRCTDKTAVAGTTYHYVVTSTTAAGVESPNSAEVDVTP